MKKEVGKVGEDSPLFIVPIDSAENKSNIANFFSKPTSPARSKRVKEEESKDEIIEKEALDKNAGDDINSETHAPIKRELDVEDDVKVKEPPTTKIKLDDNEIQLPSKAEASGFKGQSPVKTAQRKPTKRAPPVKKSPMKKDVGEAKITNFFAVK